MTLTYIPLIFSILALTVMGVSVLLGVPLTKAAEHALIIAKIKHDILKELSNHQDIKSTDLEQKVIGFEHPDFHEALDALAQEGKIERHSGRKLRIGDTEEATPASIEDDTPQIGHSIVRLCR